MDEEKLVHMLNSIQSNQNEISPELINEYNQVIINFQLSQEGLVWLIANFPNFQSGSLIIYALSTFRIWINSNWELLNEEIINNLKILLFPQAKLTNSSIDSIQASVQVSLFNHLYPEPWQSFWQDLLSLNQKIILNFLQGFVNQDFEIIRRFSFQMQNDNSETSVVQFVISNLENGVDDAFPILTQMLEWIDPTPVLQSSVISLIQQDLSSSTAFISNCSDLESDESKRLFHENINKLDCVIKLLNGIVKTSIEPSVLNNLLTQLNIIEKMMFICQNPLFENVMGSACSLISSCADIYMGTPDAPQYYQLSLLLLSHPSTEVANPIIFFINNFTETSGPEIAQSSFQALSSRFMQYFEMRPDDIDDFADSILKTIDNIIHKNEGILDAYLSNFLNSNGSLSSNDLLNLAAMFNIIIFTVQNYIHFEKRNDIAIKFSVPLLQELSPPYDDHAYYAVSSYMTFLSRVAAQFHSKVSNQEYLNSFPPVSIFQVMFVSLLNNLIIPYDEDSIFKKEKFISIANSFTKTDIFNQFIQVNAEQIIGLVKIGDFEIIKLASEMLKKFEYAERTNIFTSCMELMISLLANNDVKLNQKNVIHLMLILIQNQAGAQNSSEINVEMVQVIMPYMDKILPIASNNGEIMIVFLDTLYKAFGASGLPSFLSIINNGIIIDMEGLAKACKISLLYIKNATDISWINDCINKIFGSIGQLIQGVSNWFDISEETRQAINLISSFYELLAFSSKFLSNELNNQLLSFTESMFPILFKLVGKGPICQSIKYLHSLVVSPSLQNDANFLIQFMVGIFVPLTFQVFTDKDFQLDNGEWRQTIYSILRFHQILMKTVQEAMVQKVSEVFNQFPQSEKTSQALSKYIELLQGDDIISSYKFVQEILRYLQQVLYNS